LEVVNSVSLYGSQADVVGVKICACPYIDTTREAALQFPEIRQTTKPYKETREE
jgi:hypothetical protein